MRSAPNPDALNRLRTARARVSQQLAPMKGALQLLSNPSVQPGTIVVATKLIADELEWIEELAQASKAAEEAYMRSAVLHVLNSAGLPPESSCGGSVLRAALDDLAPGVREEWERRRDDEGPVLA